MSYVTDNLLPGERVIHQARLHWIIFVAPGLLVLFGLLGLTAADRSVITKKTAAGQVTVTFPGLQPRRP